MKINTVLLCISAAIAGLAAFGFYTGCSNESYRVLITIGSGLSLFITLGGLLAISSPAGGSTNLKLTSAVFFIALLIEQIIFAVAGVTLTPYIVITGIVLLVYILICYAIIQALKGDAKRS